MWSWVGALTSGLGQSLGQVGGSLAPLTGPITEEDVEEEVKGNSWRGPAGLLGPWDPGLRFGAPFPSPGTSRCSDSLGPFLFPPHVVSSHEAQGVPVPSLKNAWSWGTLKLPSLLLVPPSPLLILPSDLGRSHFNFGTVKRVMLD